MTEIITRGRWTARSKATLVKAVEVGEMTLAELDREHGISSEEFASWQRLLQASGQKALRATKLQSYRYERTAMPIYEVTVVLAAHTEVVTTSAANEGHARDIALSHALRAQAETAVMSVEKIPPTPEPK